MNPVLALRTQARLTQSALAERANTSQPAIAAYEAGRKSPTVRTLERLAHTSGLEAHVVFVSPLTREDRRSLYLHAVISARIAAEPEATIAHARRNLKTMTAATQGGAMPLLREWRQILNGGVNRVLEVLADPSEHARDLRQVTPFAGVLTTEERQEVYRSFRESESTAA